MKTNNIIPTLIFAAIILLSVTACTSKTSLETIDKLLETDRSYSTLSANKGMNSAFISMFDSAGVKLQTNHIPIVGLEKIKAFLQSENDSGFILTWEPLSAKIANSGEIGFTYGTYKITNVSADSIMGEGTYVTIWGKNSSGQWKALLDTGNSGFGTEQE